MEVIKFQKIEFHANPLPTLTFAMELLQGPPKLILFIQNSAAKYEVRSLRLMQRIVVVFDHSFFFVRPFFSYVASPWRFVLSPVLNPKERSVILFPMVHFERRILSISPT